MKDKDKTKEQLITELGEMRQRITQFEVSEVERARTEKSLLLDEDYQRLFELFPIGVTVLDMKGVILYCNSVVYDKGGYTKGQFTGKHFSKMASVKLKDIPTYIRIFNSVVRGEIPKPFEAIYQRKDGTTGWTEISI
ncbi:PAS domain-containing protein, partial [Chloroflexota bacterium]